MGEDSLESLEKRLINIERQITELTNLMINLYGDYKRDNCYDYNKNDTETQNLIPFPKMNYNTHTKLSDSESESESDSESESNYSQAYEVDLEYPETIQRPVCNIIEKNPHVWENWKSLNNFNFNIDTPDGKYDTKYPSDLIVEKFRKISDEKYLGKKDYGKTGYTRDYNIIAKKLSF